MTGLNLLRPEGWIEKLVVDLIPYDAGTDSGASYASPNAPTAVKESIYRITESPLLIDGQVPPFGVFRFTRLPA